MSSISETSQMEINNMMRRNSSPMLIHPTSINGHAHQQPIASKPKHDHSHELCRVCGDSSAKMHYGVLTCFGCKGFFRRALKRPTEYQCRHNGTCVVDRQERNSCRYCRFKKCLDVGMDPKAVRPDRDATGRHQGRARRGRQQTDDEGEVDSEWTRKLPVDMRTTLMQLMNTDVMVNSGDAPSDARSIYPLSYTLRQLLEDTSLLDGKKTEIRYEAFRHVEQVELPAIAHRNLLAVIDWVDHLCDMMDLHNVEDKLALVKHGYAPLLVLSFSAASASCTRAHDVLCLCNYGCVPRNASKVFDDPYHLANRVVPRTLDELVLPFRQMSLREEEAVLLKAILLLNSQCRPLSADASEAVADLRDRMQETLYHVVRETHPKEVASSRFGNLLLLLPSVYLIGNIVVENLQFVDSILHTLTDPLMRDFLSLQDEEEDTHSIHAEQLQILDERPLSSSLSHSASSSSLDSLGSHCSGGSNTSPPGHHRPEMMNGGIGGNGMQHRGSNGSIHQNGGMPNGLPNGMPNGISNGCGQQQHQQQHQQQQQQPQQQQNQMQNGMAYNLSSSSLPGMISQYNDQGMNAATSMPNLGPMGQQQQNMNDNDDPDYNLTLTPDMVTGIRQAMSVAHNLSEHGGPEQDYPVMDVDPQCLPPPPQCSMGQPPPQQQQQQQQQQRMHQTPPESPMDRPQFFISTVESTKHKFTVTTSLDNRYQNGNYAPPQQAPGISSSPYLGHMNGMPPQGQQQLARTNSLPPHQQFVSIPVYTQQPPNYPPQQQQQQQHHQHMELDDAPMPPNTYYNCQ